MLVHPCHHLLFRHTWPRREHHNCRSGEIGEKGKERANIKGCSTGRSIEARQDLHIRAHRDVGVRTHRCRCLCSCLGGEQWPHLEGHAGGVNISETHLPCCDPQYLVVMTSTPGPLVAEPGWLTNARGRKYNHKVPALILPIVQKFPRQQPTPSSSATA